MHLGSTGILKIISSAGTKSMLCTGEFRGSVGSNSGTAKKREAALSGERSSDCGHLYKSFS